MGFLFQTLRLFGITGKLVTEVEKLRRAKQDLAVTKIETDKIVEQCARDRAAIKMAARQDRIEHEKVMAELKKQRLARGDLYDELMRLKDDTSEEAASRRLELVMQLVKEA